MEIVKIKKENEEKTIEIDLFSASFLILLLGWALKGIVKVNINGKQ
jgi:hypothetical protein